MPKYQNQCPVNNELDLYSKCSFNCVYCITEAECNKNKIKVTKPEFSINHFSAEKSLNNPFYLSPWTDCYQHKEEKEKKTEKVIKQLSDKNLSFFVITKGTLVLRDIKYFMNNKKTFIAISLNCLDDSIIKIMEPNAPSASSRKKLIEEIISKNNIKIVIKIDPIIPAITDSKKLTELSEWICKIRPYAVTAETLRLTDDISNNMKSVLSEKQYLLMLNHYEKIGRKPVHPSLQYRLRIFNYLSKVLLQNNIPAAFCRATLPSPITEYDCRGGFP